jgi:hypothetical protein
VSTNIKGIKIYTNMCFIPSLSLLTITVMGKGFISFHEDNNFMFNMKITTLAHDDFVPLRDEVRYNSFIIFKVFAKTLYFLGLSPDYLTVNEFGMEIRRNKLQKVVRSRRHILFYLNCVTANLGNRTFYYYRSFVYQCNCLQFFLASLTC